MQLDLINEKRQALAAFLRTGIDADRYPLSALAAYQHSAREARAIEIDENSPAALPSAQGDVGRAKRRR